MNAADNVVFLHPEAETPGITEVGYPFVGGPQNSILQPHAHLRQAGYACALATAPHGPGVYVVHPDHLQPEWIRDEHFFVLTRNDRYMQMSWKVPALIEQNPWNHHPNACWPRFFVPFYPQRGLIPRDHALRGNRFEVVAFMGREVNLHADFSTPEFAKWMRDAGLEWRVLTDPEAWADFRDVDAVLALRDYHDPCPLKPANKLVNAWHAGIPALLGPESAFQWYRQSPLDYFEIRSLDDAKRALLRLRDEPELRAQIRENAKVQSIRGTFASVTQAWTDTLDRAIKPRATRWFSSAQERLKVKTLAAWGRLSGVVTEKISRKWKQMRRY